jgi:hypothetical protein
MSTAYAAPASSTPVYMDPDALFDQDIFTLLGIPDASETKKQELMDTMMKSINNRVFARVLDKIDDKDAGELEHLLNSDGDVDAFLKAREIDIPTIAVEEAIIYKSELAALAMTPA